MISKRLKWFAGTILVMGVIAAALFTPLPVLFSKDLPYVSFFSRSFRILLICCGFCLWRIYKGPTASDRIVAIDILGILIVGFCAIVSIPTGRNWYIDIGIAWALQSFIGTIALAKYLEGKDLDE